MTIDEMIAVLRAAKEGKKIQVRAHHADAKLHWLNVLHPIWDFHNCDYRVALSPRVFALLGERVIGEANNTGTLQEQVQRMRKFFTSDAIIVQEVLPEE